MLWFVRGLRRGVVTTRYPARVDAWAAGLPSPPAFSSHRLTAERAEAMARACPSGALRRDGQALVLDLGMCTACGRCAEVGGDAVTSSGETLLATPSRESLRKRVPIDG
jgi:ferredoxin